MRQARRQAASLALHKEEKGRFVSSALLFFFSSSSVVHLQLCEQRRRRETRYLVGPPIKWQSYMAAMPELFTFFLFLPGSRSLSSCVVGVLTCSANNSRARTLRANKQKLIAYKTAFLVDKAFVSPPPSRPCGCLFVVCL
jgi:hypothetical protein